MLFPLPSQSSSSCRLTTAAAAVVATAAKDQGGEGERPRRRRLCHRLVGRCSRGQPWSCCAFECGLVATAGHSKGWNGSVLAALARRSDLQRSSRGCRRVVRNADHCGRGWTRWRRQRIRRRMRWKRGGGPTALKIGDYRSARAKLYLHGDGRRVGERGQESAAEGKGHEEGEAAIPG